MQFKPEKITWQDHSGVSGWTEISELEKLLPIADIISIGFVVKETEDFLWLASDLHEKENCCASVNCILKGAITSRKKLKL